MKVRDVLLQNVCRVFEKTTKKEAVFSVSVSTTRERSTRLNRWLERGGRSYKNCSVEKAPFLSEELE